MKEIEKYKIDYSDTAYFKGIRVLVDYLDEAVKVIKEKKILDVCVWYDINDNQKKIVNFDFLKEIPFIKTFHWLGSMSSKSDISGIYSLNNLTDFVWIYDNLTLDFSKLQTIEKLSVSHNAKILNLSSLSNLKELYIQNIHTEDLSFLSNLTSLQKIRIINASILSLNGLETSEQLKYLRLVKCKNLTKIDETLNMFTKLEELYIESCNNIEIDGKQYVDKVKRVIFFLKNKKTANYKHIA